MLERKNQVLKNELDNHPHLQKLLFEKGFLITDSDVHNENTYPFYGNWDKLNVGKYKFWIYSTVRRCFVKSPKGVFFIIGHAYNPFTMEINEERILQSIASAYDTEKYYDVINELTGVFILGVVQDDIIEFLLDASGMQYGCYGKIHEKVYISSHMRLIGDICELNEDPYVTELINYRWYPYMMGNYIAGDGTCYCEVKRIIPNTTIVYKHGGFNIIRFYPQCNIKMCQNDKEYEGVILEAADILKNTMHLISQKWERPAISLTGGIDSNTTFAAANGIYDKFTSFSYVSMYRESVDATKAKEISDAFGVNHVTYNIPEDNNLIKDFKIIKSIYNYNGGAIGPTKDVDVRKRIVLTQKNIGDVEVKSWVSETIRAYAHKYFGRKQFSKSMKPRNYTSLYKIFLFNRKLVWETDRRFAAYIEETNLANHLFNYDESDFFVWEMMHGGKCGLNISVMKCYCDITIPYNNRKLLDLLLRVPLEKRISDQHHLDMKRFMNEELYDMNIRVVNLNQPTIRGKLLNVYYTLNSILPF